MDSYKVSSNLNCALFDKNNVRVNPAHSVVVLCRLLY